MQVEIGIGYQITAVMISFIILIYFNKTRKIAVYQDKILLLIVVMNAVSTGCNIVKYFMIQTVGSANIPAGVLTGLTTVYFLLHILLMPLLCMYILSGARSWRETSVLFKVTYLVPLLAIHALIIVNIWTGVIFSHGADGTYHREKALMLVYVAAIYYILYLIGLIAYYRKYYSFTKKVVFLVEIAVVVVSVFIQFVFPQQQIETVAIAINTLILLFFIQNPAAQVDRVTNAYSKSAFYSVMKYNSLSRKKRDMYVVMLDNLQRDDFDMDYERLDAVLGQMVRFLQSLNKKGNVYRIDKYCFCIEMPKMSGLRNLQITKQLKSRFKQPWGYLEQDIYLRLKLGWISLPDEICTMEQLLGVLDRMIEDDYTEEILGVEKYNVEELERAKKITDALAKSMDNREFEMRYTPICYLKDKSIVGTEVTIRFYDDDLGYVYDDEILEFAEKAGHVANLGQMIFEHTCRIIGQEQLEKMGIDLICIQILPAMCMLQGLSDKLIDIMEKYQIDPSRICLQISEEAIAKATGVFRENMEQLADEGVKFCLTGYGSGYTNISAIYDLPFSMIKFSKSFTQSALENDKARITLECMMALSKELKMQTRVPGIDDLDYFDMISGMVCDYAEGDYFFEQLDLAGFRHMMEEASRGGLLLQMTV